MAKSRDGFVLEQHKYWLSTKHIQKRKLLIDFTSAKLIYLTRFDCYELADILCHAMLT